MLSQRDDACCRFHDSCGETFAFRRLLSTLDVLSVTDAIVSLAVALVQVWVMYKACSGEDTTLVVGVLLLFNFADLVLEMVMMGFVYGEAGSYISKLIDGNCFDGSMTGSENALFSMKGEFDAFGLVEIIQAGLEIGAAGFKLSLLYKSGKGDEPAVNPESIISTLLDWLEVIGAFSGLFFCLRPAIANFDLVLNRMDDSTCSAVVGGAVGTQMTPCIYTSCIAPKIAVTFSGGARLAAPGLGACAAVAMLMGILWA
jgi:hypothetical protein